MKTELTTRPNNQAPLETDRGTIEAPCDTPDLLQWRRKSGGPKSAPPTAAEWKDKARLFSRKEKQAVLFALLLSGAIPDEQLDEMIETVMAARGRG